MKPKSFILLSLMMLIAYQLSAQDLLLLRNGDELKAKVLEITNTEIKYKNYDNVNGPTISINKSEVFIIKYENGTKDVFTPPSSSKETTPDSKPEKEKHNTQGTNTIQFAIDMLNPLKEVLVNEGYTIISSTPPVIFSYEKSLNERFSLGGMFIYTSVKSENTYNLYSYYYPYTIRTTTDPIDASIRFIGAIGSYHFYTNDKLDITAGAALGFSSISVTGETNTTVFSERFNAAMHYYFSPNLGFFARFGDWGRTVAFDLGTSIKF